MTVSWLKHGILVISIADVIMFFNVSALPTCPNSSKHHSFYLKESLGKLSLGIQLDFDTKYLCPSNSLQTVWEVATSEYKMGEKFVCLFYSSCFTFRWTGSSDACKIALWRPSRCCGTEFFLPIRCNEAQNATCNDESRDKKVWVRD